MNNAPAKIQMLNTSLRCFAFGLLAWMPIIGIPFGVVALILSAKARAGEKQFWNAARPHRLWGVACASLAIILWSFIFILVIWSLLNPS